LFLQRNSLTAIVAEYPQDSVTKSSLSSRGERSLENYAALSVPNSPFGKSAVRLRALEQTLAPFF
jgi:hypothetical protein